MGTKKMRLMTTSIEGNSFIGVYGIASDKYAIFSDIVKNNGTFQKILKVPIILTEIASSHVVGCLCCGNSNGLLVSNFTKDSEINKLKEMDINLKKIRSKHNAVGNLVLANDRGAIASTLLEKKDISDIQDVLGVETVQSTIAGFKNVGSVALSTNKGTIAHPGISGDEAKILEDVLKVEVDVGTANFGVPNLNSCMVANSNGVIVGKNSSGTELIRIEQTLDLIG